MTRTALTSKERVEAQRCAEAYINSVKLAQEKAFVPWHGKTNPVQGHRTDARIHMASLVALVGKEASKVFVREAEEKRARYAAQTENAPGRPGRGR